MLTLLCVSYAQQRQDITKQKKKELLQRREKMSSDFETLNTIGPLCPNPAKDMVTVILSQNKEDIYCGIRNLKARVLLTDKADKNTDKLSMDVSAFERNGSYWVTFPMATIP